MKEEDYKHIAIIHNMAKDYGILTNEEIHKTYEVINKIKQLETNWKELKKWLEEVTKDIDKARKLHETHSLSEERLSSKYFAYNNTLMKMQKLEGNNE